MGHSLPKAVYPGEAKKAPARGLAAGNRGLYDGNFFLGMEFDQVLGFQELHAAEVFLIPDDPRESMVDMVIGKLEIHLKYEMEREGLGGLKAEPAFTDIAGGISA
jgi:hypothetical protein